MDLHDFHEVMAIHPLHMLLLQGLLQALAWVNHAQERGGGGYKWWNLLWRLQSSLQSQAAFRRQSPLMEEHHFLCVSTHSALNSIVPRMHSKSVASRPSLQDMRRSYAWQ